MALVQLFTVATHRLNPSRTERGPTTSLPAWFRYQTFPIHSPHIVEPKAEGKLFLEPVHVRLFDVAHLAGLGHND